MARVLAALLALLLAAVLSCSSTRVAAARDLMVPASCHFSVVAQQFAVCCGAAVCSD
jgi:hypothetical protein